MSEEKVWYLGIQGKSYGPYNVQDLRGYFQSGHINADTLAYGPGLSNWVALREIPKLSGDLLGVKRVPVSPPPPRQRNYEAAPQQKTATKVERKRTDKGPTLGKRSVWVVILLVCITQGLYVPLWYLFRKKAFDGLETITSMGAGLPWLLLFTSILFWAVLIASGGNHDQSRALVYVAGLLLITVLNFGLVQILAFRARKILMEAFHEPISGVATFLLTIMYLQYKMNRLPG